MYRALRLAVLVCPVLLLSVAACTPSGSHHDAKSSPSADASDDKNSGKGVPLGEAIGRLKTARESRAGYDRDKFRLWIDADKDGCDTRKEVLISEAVVKPR
ncbi:hypothetical protein [Streptomyces halobius]|uniref:Lipoprotein n=1 Tax=Streptomyces halobius TaxID=2879846 RepID=A0ABY4LYG4_9ACTN|nr:hypothetical protein [Streptomyces halobius]UQA90534.1 hypothetical protein K9S39_00190 [Streptomyces halobius]